MPRTIITGQPGEKWSNDTGIVYFQLHCSLINTCGYCLPQHLSIAEYFPLPYHRRCRCYVLVLAPGDIAHPFPDFRQIIHDLPRTEKAKSIGRANLQLLDSGLVTLEDLVTPTKILTLEEVIRREKLSVEQLAKAGIPRATAEKAWGAVHGPDRDEAQAPPKKIITDAGLTDEQIRNAATVLIPIPLAKKPSKPKRVGPEAAINAGNAIIERLGKRMEPRVPAPDFEGSISALTTWLYIAFGTEAIDRLTDEDWTTLAAMLAAQEELRKIFKRLKANVSEGMKAVSPK